MIEPATQQGKEDMFLQGINRFVTKQDNFSKIPGSPIAYWVRDKVFQSFLNLNIGKEAIAVKGLDTCDNQRFVRQWEEVNFKSLGLNVSDCSDTYNAKWYPYSKGGGFRKWFGFNEMVVNWSNDGKELRNIRDEKGKIKSRPQNIRYYFKEGLTWSSITSYKLSLRYMNNAIFGGGGSAMFAKQGQSYILALLNSKVGELYLNFLNPTLNFLVNDIMSIPLIKGNEQVVEAIVNNNIELSKEDYDLYETSWDFNHHPFISDCKLIKNAFQLWKDSSEHRFNQLKANEENLNKIFIDTYGLQTELSPEVNDKDVTVRKADLSRDIRSFISYAVGCMFGRYSLDVPGLVYAGGTWVPSKYSSFPADADAILPICNDEYFEDDIVDLFIRFVEKVYGKETLEENLQFIADALGGKGTSREVIRNYFINGFYADHVKIYSKRPIYWLFDSGKKNGFKCLIYLHRYKPDTIARIRTDYIHEQQSRYRTAIEDLNQRINGATASEKVKLSKKLTQVQEQAEELRIYEEKIHHLADQMIEIDLDDGVKVNYAKFQDVLAKIK